MRIVIMRKSNFILWDMEEKEATFVWTSKNRSMTYFYRIIWRYFMAHVHTHSWFSGNYILRASREQRNWWNENWFLVTRFRDKHIARYSRLSIFLHSNRICIRPSLGRIIQNRYSNASPLGLTWLRGRSLTHFSLFLKLSRLYSPASLRGTPRGRAATPPARICANIFQREIFRVESVTRTWIRFVNVTPSSVSFKSILFVDRKISKWTFLS